MSNTRNEETMVARMQFDNKQFERDVAVTMSSIDKLKSKLGFSGAAKGLAEVGNEAKKVSFDGISSGIDAVRVKFSALDVAAATVFSNLTNKAMALGSSIASAMTTQPLKDGLTEYETQINAIQTILNNTKRHGSTLKDVNDALDELNTYADKTIYNFTEMTDAIGQFTTAGIDLDTSVNAVKGISNLAAYVGAPASDASRAMFQLSQALSTGSVRLQDWMSLEHTAGMAGKEFQERLIETARVLGTGVDDALEKHGQVFRESLKEDWLTVDVLNQTLAQFAGEVDEATLRAQGFSESQIQHIMELGEQATDAATKVKTFSQLIDTLKEAMGSGWTKSWQLIIGDFEQAQELWTHVSDVLGGVIGKISDARNALIEKAMNNPFADIAENIQNAKNAIDGLNGNLQKYEDLVTSIIRGDYGNAPYRFDKLAEDGYNWAKAQNMVNERLGCSYRYAEELGGATEDLAASQAETIEKVLAMSDAELKAIGLHDDDIKALRMLAEQSERTGIPLQSLLENIDQLSGRNLLLSGIGTTVNALVNIFHNVKEAWGNVFDPVTAMTFYNAISSMHGMAVKFFNFTEQHSEQLTRILTGVFSAVDILRKILGGSLKIAISVVKAILDEFGLDALEVAANIGDAVAAFNKWIEKTVDFEAVGSSIGKAIKIIVDKAVELYNTFKNVPQVKAFFDQFKGIDLKDIGKNVIEGFKDGIDVGLSVIPESIKKVIESFIDTIRNLLGIHSPSTVMKDLGTEAVNQYGDGVIAAGEELKTRAANVMGGADQKLFEGLTKIKDTVVKITGKISEFAKDQNIDLGTLLNFGINAAMIKQLGSFISFLNKVASPAESLSNVFENLAGVIENSKEGIQNMFSGIENVLNSYSKSIKAKAWKTKAAAIKDVAISIGILTAAVYALGKMDREELTQGVAAVASLAVIVGLLAKALDTMSRVEAGMSSNPLQFKGIKQGLLGIGITMYLMANTVKTLGKMKPEEMTQGFLGLAACVTALAVIFAAYGLLVKADVGANMDKAGKMIKSITKSMLLMAIAVKIIGMLKPEEMVKGGIFAAAFVVFVGAITAISKRAGDEPDKLGKYVKSIVVALGLMVVVAKLCGTLSAEEIGKGILFAGAFLGFIAILSLITKINREGTQLKLAGLLISLTVSMALMTQVVKMIGKLSYSDIVKGGIFVAGFTVFLAAVVSITKTNSSKIVKISKLMISLAVAIGAMALVVGLLGQMETGKLVKGTLAVAVLGSILTLMISQMKNAAKAYKSILAVSLAIAVIAAAVSSLTLVDQDKLKSSTACLSVLMGVFALILYAAKDAELSIKSAGILLGAIAGLGAIFIALAAAMKYLNLGDSGMDVKTIASLSAIMITLTACCAILNKFAVDSDTTWKQTGVMLTSIAGLAAIFVALASAMKYLKLGDINVDPKDIASLSAVMIALSACCVALNKFAISSETTWKQTGVMLTSIAGLAAIFVALASAMKYLKLGDANISLETVAGLSAIMLALSGCCVILSKVGVAGGEAAIGAAKLMAVVSVAALILTGVGGLIGLIPGAEEFLRNGITVLKLLAEGLGSFIGTLAGSVLNSFMTSSTSGLEEVGKNLTNFVNSFNGVDSGALSSVESVVKIMAIMTGQSVLDSLYRFTHFGKSSLEDFGDQALIFGESMQKLSDGLKQTNIDDDAIKKAVNAGTLLKNFKESLPEDPGMIASWFVGNKNLGNFGEQAAGFGAGIAAFANAINSVTIDETIVASAVNAGNMLNGLKKSLGEEPGIVASWFVNSSADLGDFGDEAALFGAGIVAFAQEVKSITIDETAVTAAVNAGKMLAGLRNNLGDKPGAIAGWFLSDTTGLDDFGGEAAKFGSGIVQFANSIKGIDMDSDSLDAVVNAGNMLASLREALGEDPGVVASWFVSGNKGLDNFGKEAEKFGQGIVALSQAVSGQIDYASVEGATNVAKMLTEIQNGLGKIDTKKNYSLTTFGSQLKSFGSDLKNYNENISGVNVEGMSGSISIAKQLHSMFVELTGVSKDQADAVETMIEDLGIALSSYSDSVGEMNVSNVEKSIQIGYSLQTLLESLGKTNIDTEKISGFKTAVDELGKTQLSGIQNTLNSQKADFSSVGQSIVDTLGNGMTDNKQKAIGPAMKIITEIVNGMKAKSDQFKQSGSSLILAFANGMNSVKAYAQSIAVSISYYAASAVGQARNSFYNNGLNLGYGLINGINAMRNSVYNAAFNLGRQAVIGEANGQKSKSPSKATYQAGIWLGEGLINGMAAIASNVEKSGNAMGSRVTSAISNSLDSASSAIENSFDISPVITPIVDLSGAEQQASHLDGLFDKRTVGLNANLKSLNNQANMNGQNGKYDTIVNSIDKLRKTMSNAGGNTYNSVNGVTYEKGTEVYDAIETLVRATTIGRRR